MGNTNIFSWIVYPALINKVTDFFVDAICHNFLSVQIRRNQTKPTDIKIDVKTFLHDRGFLLAPSSGRKGV
jgi:hypothetical protein